MNNPITVGELFKRLNQLLTTDVQLPRKGTPDILMSLQKIAMPDNVLIQLGFFSEVLNYLIQTGLTSFENDSGNSGSGFASCQIIGDRSKICHGAHIEAYKIASLLTNTDGPPNISVSYLSLKHKPGRIYSFDATKSGGIKILG